MQVKFIAKYSLFLVCVSIFLASCTFPAANNLTYDGSGGSSISLPPLPKAEIGGSSEDGFYIDAPSL